MDRGAKRSRCGAVKGRSMNQAAKCRSFNEVQPAQDDLSAYVADVRLATPELVAKMVRGPLRTPPSRAKAQCLCGFCGTSKLVPFQSGLLERINPCPFRAGRSIEFFSNLSSRLPWPTFVRPCSAACRASPESLRDRLCLRPAASGNPGLRRQAHPWSPCRRAGSCRRAVAGAL